MTTNNTLRWCKECAISKDCPAYNESTSRKCDLYVKKKWVTK